MHVNLKPVGCQGGRPPSHSEDGETPNLPQMTHGLASRAPQVPLRPRAAHGALTGIRLEILRLQSSGPHLADNLKHLVAASCREDASGTLEPRPLEKLQRLFDSGHVRGDRCLDNVSFSKSCCAKQLLTVVPLLEEAIDRLSTLAFLAMRARDLSTIIAATEAGATTASSQPEHDGAEGGACECGASAGGIEGFEAGGYDEIGQGDCVQVTQACAEFQPTLDQLAAVPEDDGGVASHKPGEAVSSGGGAASASLDNNRRRRSFVTEDARALSQQVAQSQAPAKPKKKAQKKAGTLASKNKRR